MPVSQRVKKPPVIEPRFFCIQQLLDSIALFQLREKLLIQRLTDDAARREKWKNFTIISRFFLVASIAIENKSWMKKFLSNNYFCVVRKV